MPNVENFNRIFTHAVKDLVWVIDYDLHPNLWIIRCFRRQRLVTDEINRVVD
jgi:hypothetical protein